MLFVPLKGLKLAFDSAENDGWQFKVENGGSIYSEALASSCRWGQGSQLQECLVVVCVDEAHCIKKW